VVSFVPHPLYPREITPSTNWIGGWIDPTGSLDMVAKKRRMPASP